MEVAEMILEYLRVLLSAQMVVGVVVVTMFCLFKTEVRALINRINAVEWGSGKISAPQPASTEPKSAGNLPKPESPSLPPGIQVNPEDQRRLEQALLSERARAHYWEYRYLNSFYVFNTQRVLDWLIGLNNSTTFTTYDALWQPFISTAQERRNIVRVLEEHNLIALHGDLIEVTPKGREYVQWRGPLPSIDPSGVTARLAGESNG
jgi:hypothetical protein